MYLNLLLKGIQCPVVYASYIVDDLPKGPLSGQPKLHPVNVREKKCFCSNKKCNEVIADLRAKVYDLNLMFKELSLTTEKVIKYDLLCVKHAEMEATVLDEKHCERGQAPCKLGKTSGKPTVHNPPKVLTDVVLRTNEHNMDYQPEYERPPVRSSDDGQNSGSIDDGVQRITSPVRNVATGSDHDSPDGREVGRPTSDDHLRDVAKQAPYSQVPSKSSSTKRKVNSLSFYQLKSIFFYIF